MGMTIHGVVWLVAWLIGCLGAAAHAQHCWERVTLFHEAARMSGEHPFLADVTGDGRVDLLTLDSAKLLRVRSNAGTSFASASTLQLPAYSWINGIVDFDRDGFADLLVNMSNGWDCGSNGARIYWNSGSASNPFQGQHTELTLPLNPYCIGATPIDFDGDQWTDVIITNMPWVGSSPYRPTQTYRNLRNRSFSAVADFQWPRDLGNPSTVDLSGDGIADFIALFKNGWADGQWGILFFRGLGDGRFQPPVSNFSVERVAHGFTFAPTGSGRHTGLYVGTSISQTLRIGTWSAASNNFGYRTLAIPSPYYAQHGADLNEDGLDDLLLVTSETAGGLGTLTNQGGGQFTAPMVVAVQAPGFQFGSATIGSGPYPREYYVPATTSSTLRIYRSTCQAAELDCNFTTHPAAAAVGEGQTATFAASFPRVGATYQWRRNGVALSDSARISGSATANLSIASAGVDDQGTYTCVATSTCGVTTSRGASLTVSSCANGWLAATNAPFGQRNVHAQASSSVNAGTLVFGGTTPSNAALGDTWLLTGGLWSLVATTGPSARAYSAMAPLANGRVLLFGGQTVVNSAASSRGDTWEWSGTAWSRVATTGPSARAGHSMAFDAARNRVVLFGGLDAIGALRNDTWEWNGTAWTQVATGGPGGNFGQATAYDPVSGETLIFGGAGSGSAQTWAWNGTSWRLAATSGVSARNYPAMAFDEHLGRVVLFGGFEGGANVMGDSHVWTGAAWAPSGIGSPPQPRWKHGLSFDRAAGGLVVTAGTGYGQVAMSDWSMLTPRPQPVAQPRDASVAQGAAATFTFGVSGSGVSYRWRRNGTALSDGGTISGAAYPTLTIASAGVAEQGVYDCVATSACGSLISASATLSCRATVIEQPRGGTFAGGQQVTLTVAATGVSGATYRWRRNGVSLFNGYTFQGVSTPALTINADEPSQSGVYSVAISNPCGTTVSDEVAVEVVCPADFNDDGGIDGQDLFEFFEAWAGGLSSADLNFDGGTDGSDITAFFARWENGC
jgi:hypothetical protein